MSFIVSCVSPLLMDVKNSLLLVSESVRHSNSTWSLIVLASKRDCSTGNWEAATEMVTLRSRKYWPIHSLVAVRASVRRKSPMRKKLSK